MSITFSPERRNDFETELFVEFRDTDRNQRIRLSTWLSWLADLAGDDYSARGLGRDVLLSRNQVFLISRFHLHLLRQPVCYDTLLGETWENGTEAIWFNRRYAFSGRDHQPVAYATSTWLLCDPVGHRILRPRALEHEVGKLDRSIDCGPALQIDIPEHALKLGERRIVYTDLDANDHVFSANYGNIIMDFLPVRLQDLPYREFEINYVKEAVINESLAMEGFDSGNQYTMVGRHEDGSVCFSARLTY
ncbi:MAG: acyl carrier protein [Clostridia bacterium]|nr:acyl carrier protein [Clostridia bacterium]